MAKDWWENDPVATDAWWKNDPVANKASPSAPSTARAIGAGLGGGFMNALRGAGAAAADYTGFSDTAASLDAARKKSQEEVAAAGGSTLAGETAGVIGGMSPALLIEGAGTALAPVTGGISLVVANAVNAGFFGIPAFRDTYKEQKANGADDSTAIKHALFEAGLATVGGKLIGSGSKAIIKGGEGLAKKLGVGALEGAAFPEVQRVGEKLIDVQSGQANEKPWLAEPQSIAASALGFGALHGAQHMAGAGKRAEIADLEKQKKVALDLEAKRKAGDAAIAAQTTKLQDPAYLDDLTARAEAFNTQRATLEKAAKAKIDQNDPVAQAERQNAKMALAAFMRDETNRDLVEELKPATAAMRKRQAEKVQEEAAAAEQARVAGMTPEEWALEQAQKSQPSTAVVKATAPEGEDPFKTVTAADENAQRINTYIADRMRQPYADVDPTVLRDYLMEDPVMAQAIAEQRVPIPGAPRAFSNIVLDGLKLKLKETAKAETKKDAAAVAAEHAQRTADLSAAKVGQEAKDPLAKLRESMAQDEETRKTGEPNFDYLDDAFTKATEGTPKAVKAPETVRPVSDADTQKAQVDTIAAEIEAARTAKVTARRAGQKDAASNAFQRERDAMAKLDAMTGGDSYTRELIKQKYAQQSALDKLMDVAERLRQGQFLGQKFGQNLKPAGMVDDLNAEIASRQRQLKAGETDDKFSKADYTRLTNEISQFQEKLNIAKSAALHASDKDQTDLAATTRLLLNRQADAARGAYVKAMLEEGATHRAARGLKGITQDEALKAATEVHDLLELRSKRGDGENNEFINTRLKEIADSLGNPERERTRVRRTSAKEQTVLTEGQRGLGEGQGTGVDTQYATIEASKTAEARGETATTVGGELRRHSEYVQNLLDKAFGREMPQDVREALEKAQAALQEGRVTRDLLDATEAQATRVLEGRLQGVEKIQTGFKSWQADETTGRSDYLTDPTKPGRKLAAIDLPEDANYPRAIHDALAAMQSEQPGQMGLFETVNHGSRIKEHKDTVVQKEAEIAELEGLIGRLEKAAETNKTDIRPAAQRIVEARQRIERLKYELERSKEEIPRLQAEEKTQRAAAGEIERLGMQETEPLTHETGSGFVPDQGQLTNKANLVSASLGYFRESAANFAKSPIVAKMRQAADVLRKTTAEEKARTNIIDQLTQVKNKIVGDLQVQIDAIRNKLAEHAWIATAFPDIQRTTQLDKTRFVNIAMDKHISFTMKRLFGNKDFLLGRHLKQETIDRLGVKPLKDKAAALSAQLQAEAKKIDALIAKEAAGDPRVIAAKKREASILFTEQAIREQRKVLEDKIEEAKAAEQDAIERARNEIYGPIVARLEGKISGFTVQLEGLRTHIREELLKKSPGELLAHGKKFEDIVDSEVAKEQAPLEAALKEANAALRTVYDKQREYASDENRLVRAHQDALVQLEFKHLDKLQKKLEKLQKTGTPTEVTEATAETARQRAHAEEIRQMTNDSRDAAYKAANEKLQAQTTTARDARLAPLERKLADAETRANAIAKKNKKESPVVQAKALVDVNREIDGLKRQMRGITGQQLSAAYGVAARNKNIIGRKERLEGMVADTTLSNRRRARAQQALDIVNQRLRVPGQVEGPVARDQSAAPSKLRPGHTASQAAEAGVGTGEKGKYLDQKRAPTQTQTSKPDSVIAAELKLDTAKKAWQEEVTKAHDPALSSKERSAAMDRAPELEEKLNAAEDALAAEVERGKSAMQKAKEAKQKAKEDAATAKATEAASEGGDDILRPAEQGLEGKDVYKSEVRDEERTVLHEDARFKILDGDITGALDNMSSTAKNPVHRMLAKLLAPYVSTTKLSVRAELKAAGEYDHADNSIKMHPDHLTEEDFLHEVLHAATLQVLSRPFATLTKGQQIAFNRLKAMYEAVQHNPLFEGEYGKKHLNEFIAELHTNEALRSKLDAVGKPESLFKRIVRIVTEFFTGPKDTPSESAKLMHAVEQLIGESGRGESGTHARSKMEEFGRGVTEQRSAAKRLYEAKGGLGLAARQGVADMRAALREVLSRGDKATGMQAQVSLLSTDAYIGNTQGVAERGAMHLVKDSKGIMQVMTGGSKSGGDVLQAVGQIPAKNAEARIAIFQGYVTALRAEQLGWDKLDYDAAGVKEADAKAALAEVRADPATKAAVEHAHDVYRDLNRGMIDFLDETHSLPKEVIAAMRADKNYIPFFRENGNSMEMVMPDGHPKSIGDIRSLPFLQALKGGNTKLMSFPEAMLRNISVLTNLATTNLTNRQIAYHLRDIGRTSAEKQKPMQVQRGDGGAKQNVLRWREALDPAYPKDDGMRHIEIDTKGTIAEDIPSELLTQAVAGSYATFPALLNVAGSVSGILRTGVTRTPAYVLGQLFKDPFNASMMGNLKSNPVTAVAQVIGNFASIMRGTSVEADALRKAGVFHSNIFNGGKGDLNKIAMQMAGDQQGWIKRGLAGLDRMAMGADEATRVQVYKEAIRSGASEAEATRAARELANFGRHGSAASVQFLSRSIPFFNASIQGLDVLQRSARGQMPAQDYMNAKLKFQQRAMGLAAMAATYSLMMEDDPEWQKMSLRDKISFIHIPRIFGEYEPMRLPAPFESGMLFYSMPMAFMEALKGSFTPGDWKVVRDVFLAQMPGSGSAVPLIAKGFLDIPRNYDSSTGQQIVPKSLEGKDPIYQFTKQTTEVAKRMAEGLNAAGVKMSPMELEYLTRTYLGGLPLGVAALTNSVFKKGHEAAIEEPTGHMSENRFIGRFFQSARGTDDIEHMYEMADRAKRANDTFGSLKKSGKIVDAKEYLQAHRAEIAISKPAGRYVQIMGELKRKEDLIRGSGRSGPEKQQALDKLQETRQHVADYMRTALTAAEQRLATSAQ